MTEAKALQKLQQGSTDALKWFISKYTPYVSTIIYNIIGNSMSNADVEEVASDVFFTFWSNANKVRLSSVRGYLGSIARSKAKNKFREAGYEFCLDEDLYISEDISIEEKCLEDELHTIVKQEVLSMKEPEREILLRYYYYCQSITNIAQEMGLTVPNVKVKLHRARNVLKSTLTAYFSV